MKRYFTRFIRWDSAARLLKNDGVQEHRVLKVLDWVEHLRRLHGALYFCPVFSSDTHGYNTRDFFRIDERLGTNADFREVCRKLHESGIRVVLDGVFNHVGRGFWAFQECCATGNVHPT